MSEKRFVIGDDNIAMFEVIDMKKEELVCECRAVDVEKVCDLLNELSDENGQLKEENKYLNKRIKVISDELYCKDRKLEELGVPIECCDKI